MKTGSFEQIVNAGASSCLQRHERAKLAEGFSSTLRTDAFGDGSVKVDVYNDESILDSNNEDPTKRYRSHVVATGLKKNASLGGQPLWDESPLRHCPHGNASLHAAPPPATWHMHMREHMHMHMRHACRRDARDRECAHIRWQFFVGLCRSPVSRGRSTRKFTTATPRETPRWMHVVRASPLSALTALVGHGSSLTPDALHVRPSYGSGRRRIGPRLHIAQDACENAPGLPARFLHAQLREVGRHAQRVKRAARLNSLPGVVDL